jgi:hypothetical protein
VPTPRALAALLAASAFGLPSAAVAQVEHHSVSARSLASAPALSSSAGAPLAHASASNSAPPLTSAPPVRRGRQQGRRHGSRPPHPSTSRPTPSPGPSPARAGQGLASTGFDLPTVLLLGVGLLVSGIGLRLRTVDASRF